MDKLQFGSEAEKRRFLALHSEQASNYGEGQTPRFAFCFHCDRAKPERAHHCSLCCKCYLKMDHHCHWVANCVGYRNHKFFLVFLFYAVILAGSMLTRLCFAMSDVLNNRREFNLVLSQEANHRVEIHDCDGRLPASDRSIHVWDGHYVRHTAVPCSPQRNDH